ncbi:4-(cytidine 5'-diphospho)-2-C-methyl-D-erythritol kinase [Brevundimonas sp.]|uniref:4-(cytidine 5'-diphospho)-2-C-methyl-D-erythritol kinase n=1 Tax=Brevundimonas sp. TaxID=1871086 RepID=UPI0035B13CF6
MRAATTFAPAKVNLYLHVGPVDAEGYHPIASLGVFADVGDRVTVSPADRLGLQVTGPFAAALSDAEDNLVLRALRRLGARAGIGEPRLDVRLDKQLPVASGLGGGSSDAGAALRAGRDALSLDISDAELEAIAFEIGADGPLCLWGRAAVAEGRGERLSPAPALPPLPAVLLNPGVPSPTGAVYRAYDDGPVADAVRAMPPGPLDDVRSAVAWLAGQRNDLEAPAARLVGAIPEALALMSDAGARLTRLSGSGATVFGLFETPDAAAIAAGSLSAQRPDWWSRATTLA